MPSVKLTDREAHAPVKRELPFALSVYVLLSVHAGFPRLSTTRAIIDHLRELCPSPPFKTPGIWQVRWTLFVLWMYRLVSCRLASYLVTPHGDVERCIEYKLTDRGERAVLRVLLMLHALYDGGPYR